MNFLTTSLIAITAAALALPLSAAPVSVKLGAGLLSTVNHFAILAGDAADTGILAKRERGGDDDNDNNDDDNGDNSGAGGGGDDDNRGNNSNDENDNNASGRDRPRIPGGSGCDDPGDILEHPECSGGAPGSVVNPVSGSGRDKPRIPGGSGCDDLFDLIEHPECRI